MMKPIDTFEDPTTLVQRAIKALEQQIALLQEKRAQLYALAMPANTLPTPTPKRTMSAEARAKISKAAKRRWAQKKKAQKKASK